MYSLLCTITLFFDPLEKVQFPGDLQIASGTLLSNVRGSNNRVIIETSLSLSLRATGVGGCHREATQTTYLVIICYYVVFFTRLMSSSAIAPGRPALTHPLLAERPEILPSLHPEGGERKGPKRRGLD